ncbi:outer membrane protein [Brucella rhizosphaerae]|uniref:Outer membrane insertion C-terminal signal domain protein n=1 Tax=Brucella rhizosphaerae TaxID=571254 RepID=A0A256FKP9_9HYPH|nr:outer membrane beta-barrel protein [Brucella rhizosphaerae]OYR15423.1 outer membrane insertion C-terminal signal domain protein [Brucella rhizosphaerae]
MSFIAKLLTAATAAIALTTNAYAADLSNNSSGSFDYETPPAFSWSGAYIGAHGGLASPKVNPFTGGKGMTGGVQAGYNFQFGPGVIGAELEGSYMGNEARVPHGRLSERFRGAAKARAGLSFDQSLVYGTAGLTMTKFKDGDDVTGPSGRKPGYLLGGGIEQGFGGGLSAKIEYNYVTTKDVSTTTSYGTTKTNVHDHVIKAGVNYRF